MTKAVEDRSGSLSQGGWAKELLRRLFAGHRGWGASRGERQLEVIETLSLGGRRQVVLLRCGGTRILVGLGTESVDSLLRLPEVRLPDGNDPGAPTDEVSR